MQRLGLITSLVLACLHGAASLVDSQDAASYRGRGHAITRGLLNRTQIEAVAGSLRVALQEHGRKAFSDNGGKKEVRFTFAIHELDEAAAAFVADRHGQLWRAARELAGVPELCILMDRGFSKDPGDLETHWHRDDEAIGLPVLHPMLRTVHAWIPLTAMGREFGTLQYLAGSHRRVYDWHEQLLASLWGWDFVHFSMAQKNQDDNLELGDIAWHDGWVIHSAGSNEAQVVRDGLAISFAYCPGPGRCGGAAAPISDQNATCRIARQLFDENWKARHRNGEEDYLKTQLEEPLLTRTTRFLFRSVVGAAVGFGAHWLGCRCFGKPKEA